MQFWCAFAILAGIACTLGEEAGETELPPVICFSRSINGVPQIYKKPSFGLTGDHQLWDGASRAFTDCLDDQALPSRIAWMIRVFG